MLNTQMGMLNTQMSRYGRLEDELQMTRQELEMARRKELEMARQEANRLAAELGTLRAENQPAFGGWGQKALAGRARHLAHQNNPFYGRIAQVSPPPQ